MIFPDGDHSAGAVYRKIQSALRKLSECGVIVLHDVCPDGKPLWEGQAPILGPGSAVGRFEAEQSRFWVVTILTPCSS
jgi:predicted O-methyltransferase YrrM